MTKLFGWRYVEDRDTLCLTLAEGWRDEFSSLRELLKDYGWTWDRRRREWHLVEASNHDDLPHHMKDIGFELDIIPGNMANAWELKWREILEPVRKIRQKLAAAKKAESQMKGQTDMPTPFIFSNEEEEPEQPRQLVKASSGLGPRIKRVALATKVIKGHEVVHWEIEADDSTLNGIVRTLRDIENATLWATRLPEAIHLAGQFQSTQAKIEVLCALIVVPATREIKQKIQDELIAAQLELVVNQKEEEKKMPIIDTTDEGSPLSGLRDHIDDGKQRGLKQQMREAFGEESLPPFKFGEQRSLQGLMLRDEDERITTKEMKEGLKQTAAEKRQILAERKELLARMKKKNDAIAQQILEEGKQALAEVNEVAERRVQRLEAKERRLRKMRRKSKSEMAVQTLTVSSILSLILLWIYGALRGRKPPVLAIEHEMEGKSVLALPAPKEEPVTVSEALGESAPPEVPFVAPTKPKRAPKAKAKAKKDA